MTKLTLTIVAEDGKKTELQTSPWCDGCGKNRISRIGKPHQL